MEVRSEPTPISSREPFSVNLQKSQPVHSPTPTSTIPNMRMTFSSDGTSIYKQVSATSPPPFHGGGGGGAAGAGTIGAGGVSAPDGAAHPTGYYPRPRVNPTEQPLKRKRGRPRKYGPDGSMSPGFAPVTSSSTHKPAAISVHAPAPAAVAAPSPAPASALAPSPSPAPTPAPASVPSPAPAPVSVPSPAPMHAPVPSPAPPVHTSVNSPAPVHTSVPSPAPVHTSVPSPAPVHASVPSPAPGHASALSPAQAPVSVPSAAPVSAGFSSSTGTGIPMSPRPSEGVSIATVMKKPRGRPPGSGTGKKRQMTVPGSETERTGFDPHVVTVKTGEDVSSKIMLFLQQGPQAVCILSANGSISNVTLRQAATSGGTVTYEGRFEILSLSGSYFLSEVGGQRSRTGGLSISLAGPDGRVLGGGVAGVLTAASPVQLVLAGFNADERKEQKEINVYDPTPVTRLPQGNFGPSSPPSRSTPSESSGGPGSPFNQATMTYNNGTPQGMPGVQWK